MKKIYRNSKYRNVLTKQYLIKEYSQKEQSTIQIAKKVKCGYVTVYNYFWYGGYG